MPFVNTQPQQFSSVSSFTAFGSGIVSGVGPTGYLPANIGRSLVYVQAVGSGAPLYVSLGQSMGGTGDFNIILAPSTTHLGGNGGVWQSDKYRGPIYVSGAPLAAFVLWESKN